MIHIQVFILALCGIGTGVFDGLGFAHASRIWSNGFNLQLFLLSLGYFMAGILLYIFSLKYLGSLGVTSPTIQTSIWFISVIITVAVYSGDIWRWGLGEKIAALMVISWIAWLQYAVGE